MKKNQLTQKYLKECLHYNPKTGISWNKNYKKWETYIKINYKHKNLGYYDNFEDAIRARYDEEVNNPDWKCSINSSAYLYLKERNLL